MAISRYRSSEIIDIEGEPRYLETLDFPDQLVLEKISTFKIRVSKFDRLDQLAGKYLGAGEYWWVIAVLNDIDWVYNINDGQILKIPINVEDVLALF